MASNERVHPNCVNASNPYHECGVACLEQIAHGHGRKEKKKSDYGNGIKGGPGKKMDAERRANSNCPKASNPYHECNEYCSNRIVKANPRGNEKESGSILGGSLSFQKKKNGSGSQPESPGMVNNGSAVKAVYPADTQSPRLPLAAKNRVESDNSQSSSSSQLRTEESYSRDLAIDKRRVRPSEIVPVSGIVTSDGPNSPPNASFASFAFGTLAKQKENGKISKSPKAVSSPVAKNVEAVTTVPASPKAVSSPVVKNVEEVIPAPIVKPRKYSFSGISQATEDSDEEDSVSVVSDSYVAVGKYLVRPNLASTLQSIIEKYGDIAENCSLESSSLRSYHLECLCSVAQELQSTPFNQLTKGKVKEMLAVLKDVESAQIDVSWLRRILDEHTEVVDLNTSEAEKADCDRIIESKKKELELLTEELAQKEQAVAETKTQIEETRSHLNELELQSSRLSDAITSAKTKLEKFHGRPLVEGIL